jgi:hypothetical protein
MDFIDRKTKEVRGDITAIMKTADVKFLTSVDLLAEKKVFTKADVKVVQAMPPFAKISV